MPRDAVIVECRFSRTNLMVVNMSEKGNPANVFFQNKPEKCVRPHMFAHCQPTHDYVTIWAVVMNVTGTNRRTVFCNRTTDAGQYRTFESFNITLGDSVSWVIILVVDAVVLQAVVSSHQRLSCDLTCTTKVIFLFLLVAGLAAKCCIMYTATRADIDGLNLRQKFSTDVTCVQRSSGLTTGRRHVSKRCGEELP
ncbi:hypothetical protein C0Q70_12656 [Pomacea canaliculata]|uniref:Uncharacterized protein n=1 Tax=Pomacea canaliculata TaxID=400727 RepID=A0A2T7P241_POMCA|nr:hypothetical protein C0Q70_12656 [Pomacea canaliculata]